MLVEHPDPKTLVYSLVDLLAKLVFDRAHAPLWQEADHWEKWRAGQLHSTELRD